MGIYVYHKPENKINEFDPSKMSLYSYNILGLVCKLASSQRILVVRDPSKILGDSKISRQF